MYRYDKYTAVPNYVEGDWGLLDGSGWPSGSTNYGYSGYTFSSSTGSFTVTGSYNYIYRDGDTGYIVSGGTLFRTNFNKDVWSDGCYYFRKKVAIGSAPIKGAFVTSLISSLGIYPDNGKYSDGYWYIKVTAVPQSTTISPSQNSTISKPTY